MSKARFIGTLDFAPQDAKHPDIWTLERDFGFLRSDGLLIIALEKGRTDGASIPRPCWRFVGHPFYRKNRFWALPHDAGYRGYAIIVDTRLFPHTPIEWLFENWADLPAHAFIHSADLSRKFWDNTLLQAMRALGEIWLKRFVVYRSVRLFGWASYKPKSPVFRSA